MKLEETGGWIQRPGNGLTIYADVLRLKVDGQFSNNYQERTVREGKNG